MAIEKKPQKKTLGKELKNRILRARKMIDDVFRSDGNEAETRQRIERIFESLMGYEMHHLSPEHAVSGAGGSVEYCDFVIKVDEGPKARPVVMIEIKRAGVDLYAKHLKQVASYAINEGCEWIILTNGRAWELHHVSFGQPPITKLVDSWSLMDDEPIVLAEKFDSICFKNVKRGMLKKLWEKTNVLTPRNLIQILMSADSIALVRRDLRKASGVSVAPEEIVLAFRKLLNEKARDEMEGIKICLAPQRKPAAKKKGVKNDEKPQENDAASADGGVAG